MRSLVVCTFSGVNGYNEIFNNQLSMYISKTIMSISWFYKVSLIIYIYAILTQFKYFYIYCIQLIFALHILENKSQHWNVYFVKDPTHSKTRMI